MERKLNGQGKVETWRIQSYKLSAAEVRRAQSFLFNRRLRGEVDLFGAGGHHVLAWRKLANVTPEYFIPMNQVPQPGSFVVLTRVFLLQKATPQTDVALDYPFTPLLLYTTTALLSSTISLIGEQSAKAGESLVCRKSIKKGRGEAPLGNLILHLALTGGRNRISTGKGKV